MKKTLETLHEVYSKLDGLSNHYTNLPARDIRRVYFDILLTQIAVCEKTLKIINDYAIKNKEDFEALLTTEQQREDYYFHFIQNIAENVFEAALFQKQSFFSRFFMQNSTVSMSGRKRTCTRYLPS